MRLAPAAFPLALLLVAAGCGDKADDTANNTGGGGSTDPVDADGDGIFEDNDCDDADDSVYPGADELCDGIDNDCDDEIDEDAVDAGTYYGDADADGYGAADAIAAACAAPDGFVEDDTDCDDDDAAVNPGAAEVCNDIDDDCDGLVDDADDSVDTADGTLFYGDADEDGYGDAAAGVMACAAPEGFRLNSDDCDDTTAEVNPGAVEICNDVDDDCDGLLDDLDDSVDLSTARDWYADTDSDGYGDATNTVTTCAVPSGYLDDDTDCDDGDAAINPAATEICDADDVDEDCDGTADDADSSADTAGTGTLYYPDADTDGYGDDTAAGTAYCDDPSTSGDTWLTDNTDCDDGASGVNPGETEVCDADDVDEDCNGTADDADSGVAIISGTLWYPDTDGDGYGDADDAGTLYCDDPSAGAETWLSDNTDCDDTTDRVSPAGTEVCDGLDNDCDATTSEDGMAAFEDSSGTWTDETTTLTGSAGSPVAAEIVGDGTLYVCDGTWTWNLTISATAADIVGVNGSATTLIDGDAASSVVTIASGSTVGLSGLTIQNGATEDDGAGILVDGGILVADDIVLDGNAAGNYGGGIYVDGGGEATLIDCEITGNTADRGAGGFTDNSSYLEVDTCVVDANEADSWGGGLEVYQSAELSVLSSTISDNVAGSFGGGIECNSNGIIAIADSDIVDNTATGINGGGIDLYTCDLAIDDSLLDGNGAGSSGGGIYVNGSAAVIADGLELASNTATNGGGLYALGELDIANSDIYSNVAVSTGGGVYVNHTGSSMAFSAVDFSANTPSDVYSGDDSSASSWGLAATFVCDSSGCY